MSEAFTLNTPLSQKALPRGVSRYHRLFIFFVVKCVVTPCGGSRPMEPPYMSLVRTTGAVFTTRETVLVAVV